jgi:pimeloyl-ACP methyl ester carboxylesterase
MEELAMVDRAEPHTKVVPTPAGATVRIIERLGNGAPVVFLHSGVGSAGEWRQVFNLWPDAHRLVAVDAFGDGDGPGRPGCRTVDDFADQILGVAEYVAEAVHLVGFSWGGVTALQVGVTAPGVLASLTVIEPEAYGLLTPADGPAYLTISALRDRCRDHVRADRWYEAYQEFVDFYNGPGSFAGWPATRRARFLDDQRKRGDMWDVLFEAPLTADKLASVSLPVHVVEGSATSVVDHTICALVLRHLRRPEHILIEGAGHMIPLTHAAALTGVLLDSVTG